MTYRRQKLFEDVDERLSETPRTSLREVAKALRVGLFPVKLLVNVLLPSEEGFVGCFVKLEYTPSKITIFGNLSDTKRVLAALRLTGGE